MFIVSSKVEDLYWIVSKHMDTLALLSFDGPSLTITTSNQFLTGNNNDYSYGIKYAKRFEINKEEIKLMKRYLFKDMKIYGRPKLLIFSCKKITCNNYSYYLWNNYMGKINFNYRTSRIFIQMDLFEIYPFDSYKAKGYERKCIVSRLGTDLVNYKSNKDIVLYFIKDLLVEEE